MCENGDVDLPLATIYHELEVRLHIMERNAVLVEKRACDALAHTLLSALLYRSAGKVIKELALLDRRAFLLDRPSDTHVFDSCRVIFPMSQNPHQSPS